MLTYFLQDTSAGLVPEHATQEFTLKEEEIHGTLPHLFTNS